MILVGSDGYEQSLGEDNRLSEDLEIDVLGVVLVDVDDRLILVQGLEQDVVGLSRCVAVGQFHLDERDDLFLPSVSIGR